MRVGFRYANKFGSRCSAPQTSEEANQLRQRHRGRSSSFALFSHQASSINLRRNRLTLMQALSQFCERWPLRDFFDLS